MNTVDFIAVLIVAVTVFVEYVKGLLDYWKNHNLLCVEQGGVLGYIWDGFFKLQTKAKVLENVYEDFKTHGFKHGGAFYRSQPLYVLMTPKFMNTVLVSNADSLTKNFDEVPPLKFHKTLDTAKTYQELSDFVKDNGFGKDSLGSFYSTVMHQAEESGKTPRNISKFAQTLKNCLKEVEDNQEIKEQLVKEISACADKRESIASDLGNLKYMDQVVYETLRKYPITPFLTKKFTRQFNFPDTKVTIDRGIPVVIPVAGIHSDPDYYPQPEKFDPERFSQEKLSNMDFTFWPTYGPTEVEHLKLALTCILKNTVTIET